MYLSLLYIYIIIYILYIIFHIYIIYNIQIKISEIKFYRYVFLLQVSILVENEVCYQDKITYICVIILFCIYNFTELLFKFDFTIMYDVHIYYYMIYM